MTIRKDFINTNYGCTIKFILTDDFKKVVKPIHKKLKIKEEPCECEGEVLPIDSNLIYLVIDSKYFTWNTIFHECYHLVSAICEVRNVNDEESKSWVMGWIGQQLTKFFEQKKLKPLG